MKDLLHGCKNCADAATCNLPDRCTKGGGMGCEKWRCEVCRGPWWAISMNHRKCLDTGVPNGIRYHDGSAMKPMSFASGHILAGEYCQVHKSTRCAMRINK